MDEGNECDASCSGGSVTRPRVADAVNHKVEKFTIDALVSMLARIGKEVRLDVR
jgi:predicted XRE-type DNA-binding protein